MKTLDDAPFLDATGAPAPQDRHTVLSGLREESWVVRTAVGGLVIDRAHVQALLSDRRLRSPLITFIEMQGVTDGLVHERMSLVPLAMDGPDHIRIRTLVRKAFVPSAVERHRPLMRDTLDALIAPVLDAGRCDLMATVAEHFPIQIMCHVLGVPTEDHEDFAAWIRAISWTLSLQLAAHIDEAEDGMKRLDDYVSGLVADRRRAPGDDLVTELVQAEEAGDRLSDDELHSLVIGLLFAGYDTTRNQLGLGVHAFAHHPDQWRLLAERPELAAQAVEEVMRYHGAVDVAPRMVAEDLELDGYRFPAGTLLFLSTAAANHDPAVTQDPGVFDITAERAEQQLTFGGGPHYCLGAWLARAEMQEAFPRLARAMPGLALDGEPTWPSGTGIFGPQTLPIRFDPR
jgi:cytochrome P450